MHTRPRGPLARFAILAAVSVAVVASQVIQPLTANALTPPPPSPKQHATPTAPPTSVADPTLAPGSKPRPWSAASAKPRIAPQPSVNAAAVRAQAIASAAATERTASITVSPASLRFLRTGLGMPLGAMTTFTGVRSGSSLTISLPAPERLRSSVPGAACPPSPGHC